EQFAVRRRPPSLRSLSKRVLDASDERSMVAIGRMHSDPKDRKRRVPQNRRGQQRRCEASPRPACPGDHRPAGKDGTGRRRPDPEGVLRERNAAFLERRERTFAVKPGRGDETGDWTTDHLLDQRAALGDARACLVSFKTKELAFAGGH